MTSSRFAWALQWVYTSALFGASLSWWSGNYGGWFAIAVAVFFGVPACMHWPYETRA